MTMDIHIHSKLTITDTAKAIANSIEELRGRYGDRFWFSEIIQSSPLSKEVLSEDFGFQGVCEFIVSDTTKEFDGLDIVARALRNAIKEQHSIVVYGDSSELFPKEDYVPSV